MKAVVLAGPGFGLDQLRVVERPEPKPGRGQIALRMRAASLNYRDLLMVLGRYNPRQKLPLVPCSDGVGEVAEVGEGVTRVGVGDRVCPIFAQGYLGGEPSRDRLRTTLGGPRDGTLAERMVVDAESVVPVPEHLTDEQAATLPCAAVTAWNALITQGALRPGQVVLCLGTGGVSVFALLFAKLAGARVFVTSKSDEKLARARQLGADESINYVAEPEWGEAARRLTSDVGVDHVIEVGGGATLAQSVRAVRIGGTISIIGMLSGVATDFNVVPVLMQNLRLQGVFVGHRQAFEDMNRAIASAELRPVVDRVFELGDVRGAFEYLERGAHFGKVVVSIAG